MKSTLQTTENHRLLGSLSTSSIRNLLPRSVSSKHSKSTTKISRFLNNENAPPLNPNIQFSDPPLSPSLPLKSPPSSKLVTSNRSDECHAALPSLEPPVQVETKPLLDVGSDGQSDASASFDPSVKVVVRIRPGIDHERDGHVMVKKVSSDSLAVGNRRFSFDSVLDSNSNQEDIFQLVGIPLVKSALAGYNATILSCGQTGSGKSYTMWGPPSAMVEDPSPSSHQGVVPRIFQMLFSEIQREQENSDGKQINYQCRCSFLEIYNDQIGDLLDPMQRNLEIRDDLKNGLYVENLTEEYVNSFEDVTQVLIKGLSSRKIGATSINSKSSRSHVVCTLIIESWCKGTSSKCFSSSKISRICFVDLAGLDRNKLDDKSRQSAREGKHVKKSLSQLGHLVNTLAKEREFDKSEDALYKKSCLTRYLRESLGGNAKLTVICSISPNNRNNGETLRTLRFGQQVKSIKNAPVINEISEDDVNDLSDQIRQLKEELIRAKTDVHKSVRNKNIYFKGQTARESLNQLRVSLNRSLMLPHIDNDSDNEVNVDENDVRELHQQLNSKLDISCDQNSRDVSDNRGSIQFASVAESFETDLMSEDEVNGPDEIENEVVDLQKRKECVTSEDDPLSAPNSLSSIDSASRKSISISSCHQSQAFQEPTLSESPKIGNNRRSMVISSTFSASQNNVLESSNFKSNVLSQSINQNGHICSSLHSSKIFPGPTESLAASLQRGLQIIDHHQKNSASNRSSIAFSFEHLALRPCLEADKVDDSIQKLAEGAQSSNEQSGSLLCASCQQKINDKTDVEDSLKTWIVAANEEKPKQQENQVTKDAGNYLTEATKSEKELENICREQAAKIEQLNQLVEQYKQESLKSQMVLCGESESEVHESLNDQNKLLSFNDFENKQEIIKEKCEIKEVQEVLNHGKMYFDMEEKEALLKEVQSLKAKLQSYTDAPANKSTDMLRSSLLAQSIQLRKSMSVNKQNGNEEELEKERLRWMEMESDWISLTDELRIEIETNRQRAEQVEMELKLEKKCTEELDDALRRAVLGHARMVEHYAELQEKHNDLVGKHRAIMEGIAEVKKAAAKAGKKRGNCFAKSVAAELSTLRAEREREREFLKKENKNLKIQLRDTAEAVHAAGELLVRLREAEQAASAAEEKYTNVQQENEKLKKQTEKIKRKHKMEMITMKQYLAESRLPESALQTLYRDDSDAAAHNTIPDDDQAWRAEFGAIYQDHY